MYRSELHLCQVASRLVSVLKWRREHLPHTIKEVLYQLMPVIKRITKSAKVRRLFFFITVSNQWNSFDIYVIQRIYQVLRVGLYRSVYWEIILMPHPPRFAVWTMQSLWYALPTVHLTHPRPSGWEQNLDSSLNRSFLLPNLGEHGHFSMNSSPASQEPINYSRSRYQFSINS